MNIGNRVDEIATRTSRCLNSAETGEVFVDRRLRCLQSLSRRLVVAGCLSVTAAFYARTSVAQRLIGSIKGIAIIEEDDRSVTFTAGAAIDGDGANGQFGEPHCYAPSNYQGRTLDVLANAGHPGNWYGVVTDTNRRDGKPVLQSATDPVPGAYISATSLHLSGQDGKPLPIFSPYKYVDAATVPFVAVPPLIITAVPPLIITAVPPLIITSVAGVVLGCRVVVTNISNGRSVEAVVADQGPPANLGEVSLACARAIGLPVDMQATHPANGGGTDDRIIHYQIFPGIAATVNGVSYPLQSS